MLIILDETLEFNDRYNYKRTAEYVTKKVIKPENSSRYVGYDAVKKTYLYSKEKEFVLSHNISNDAPLYHSNYLEYLTQCYAMHNGIMINADIIWYQVLAEIAAEIKSDPELYRDLFTDSDEKKDIVVMTHSVEHLPLEEIIEQLKNLVPCDVTAFFPTFTTTTFPSAFAFNVAFADACSPYYKYMTMLCGFPRIRIDMTEDDCNRLNDHLVKLVGIFGVNRLKMVEYLKKVFFGLNAFYDAIESNDVDFFKNFLTTKSCGSGGEIKCDGWWPKTMYIKDMSGEKPENFPSAISRVEYKNLETNRNFTLNTGLFYSTVSDGIATPQWAIAVTEIKD